MKPKVKLTGRGGDAFSIIGAVSAALKKAGQGDKVADFAKEAMSGDYDHLLQTVMKYADVS